jgi:hypothetical protein
MTALVIERGPSLLLSVKREGLADWIKAETKAPPCFRELELCHRQLQRGKVDRRKQ